MEPKHLRIFPGFASLKQRRHCVQRRRLNGGAWENQKQVSDTILNPPF